MIEYQCSIGQVAVGLTINWEVSVGVDASGVGFSSIDAESGWIGHWKIDDMCCFEIFISIKEGMGS